MYVVLKDAREQAAKLARQAARLAKRVEGEHTVVQLLRLVREAKRLSWLNLNLALEIGTRAEPVRRSETVPDE